MINLSQINAKLRSRKITHQDAPNLKGAADLKRATVKLERQTRALEKQVNELRASRKVAAPAAPAKKVLASKTVVVDGKTVTLGPGEELTSLVVPKTMGAIPKHPRNSGKKI